MSKGRSGYSLDPDAVETVLIEPPVITARRPAMIALPIPCRSNEQMPDDISDEAADIVAILLWNWPSGRPPSTTRRMKIENRINNENRIDGEGNKTTPR